LIKKFLVSQILVFVEQRPQRDDHHVQGEGCRDIRGSAKGDGITRAGHRGLVGRPAQQSARGSGLLLHSPRN